VLRLFVLKTCMLRLPLCALLHSNVLRSSFLFGSTQGWIQGDASSHWHLSLVGQLTFSVYPKRQCAKLTVSYAKAFSFWGLPQILHQRLCPNWPLWELWHQTPSSPSTISGSAPASTRQFWLTTTVIKRIIIFIRPPNSC